MKKQVICHDIYHKAHEVSSDSVIFRPSAYGILIEEDKILLSTQRDGYDFPGGGIKIDETVEEAVEREFFEETGLQVKVVAPILCKSSFFTPPIRPGREKVEYWNCQMMYFLVKKIGGTLTIDNLDDFEKTFCGMPKWVDLKDIGDIKFVSSGVADEGVKIINGALQFQKNFKSV